MQDYAEANHLISSTQRGFRPGMGTSGLLQYFLANLESAHLTKKDLYILYVDFSSAFNTIGHEQLHTILEHMGYPKKIRDALTRIYEKPTTSIVTKYGNTNPIELKRGTIQGDTLSPLVFLIFLDPLMQWIRATSTGAHCELSSHTATCGGYADDLQGITNSYKNNINK